MFPLYYWIFCYRIWADIKKNFSINYCSRNLKNNNTCNGLNFEETLPFFDHFLYRAVGSYVNGINIPYVSFFLFLFFVDFHWISSKEPFNKFEVTQINNLVIGICGRNV